MSLFGKAKSDGVDADLSLEGLWAKIMTKEEPGTMAEHLENLESSRSEIRHAFKRLGEGIFEELKVGKDEKLLEIGEGAGFFRNYMVPKQYRSNLTGIEPNPELHQIAANNDTYGSHILANAEDMSTVPDGTFDRVFAANVFNSVPREIAERILKEIYRVLKVNGQFHSVTDLVPSEASIIPYLLEKEGLSSTNGTYTSSRHSNGLVVVRIGNREEEIGSCFTRDVLPVYLNAVFGNETKGTMIQRGPVNPIATAAPIIVANPNCDLIAYLRRELLPKLPRWAFMDHPLSYKRHKLATARKIEYAGIYFNSATKLTQ